MTSNRDIGVDIVDISRIKASFEKYGESFLQRVLTGNEIRHCRKKPDMMASVAARFAAKEALSKALGRGISEAFGWQSVEVLNDGFGRPVVNVLDKSLGIEASSIKISLSHDGPFAVAFVLLDR
ncbi:holo-ACP synthase [Prosthecochloris aestuarii]|nr:holo-ACP synthase [Prosthecochloris aestuarii]